MANCKETIAELDRFLDGELSDGARAHIHAHLAGCTDCLQAFDFQAELKAAIRRKCSNDEMPAGLLGRIEACLAPGFGTELSADPGASPAGGTVRAPEA